MPSSTVLTAAATNACWLPFEVTRTGQGTSASSWSASSWSSPLWSVRCWMNRAGSDV
jgi:hypothetical protein